jgi:glycosyltransferase involved in cell wall biosynthesis
MNKDKILFIQNRTDPYWVKYYDELAKQGFDFFVLFLYKEDEDPWSSWNRPQALRFKHQYLSELSGIRNLFLRDIAGFLHFKNKSEAEVIICSGYTRVISWLFLFWTFFKSKRFVLISDSNILPERKKSFIFRALKKIYLLPFAKLSRWIWCMGVCNEQYWRYYGASGSKLRDGGYYPVDTRFFLENVRNRRTECGELKTRLQLENKKVILYIGRFVPVKGLEILIEAFSKMAEIRKDAVLLLVGEGKEETALKALAHQRGIANILFIPARANEDLPLYYGMADIYVQPSRFEPAGIVILEALASGVPVIASDVCGYGQQMIKPGMNGYLFKDGNAEDLKKYLSITLDDNSKRLAMAKHASESAALWDYRKLIPVLRTFTK